MHGALLRGRDWARVGEGIMRVRGGKRESVEAAKAHLVRPDLVAIRNPDWY